ncbi:MAG: hypothetical protein WC405_19475, partial [Syntrophales bacterium]
ALLGFFPGMASDAKITQSQSYWRGEARPFAILEHAVSTAGVASVVMQNVDASGTMTIRGVSIGNNTTTSGLSTSFAPGEVKTVTVGAVGTGTSGNVYDLNVTITYDSPSLTGLKQYGAKNIMGKYT